MGNINQCALKLHNEMPIIGILDFISILSPKILSNSYVENHIPILLLPFCLMLRKYPYASQSINLSSIFKISSSATTSPRMWGFLFKSLLAGVFLTVSYACGFRYKQTCTSIWRQKQNWRRIRPDLFIKNLYGRFLL